MALKEELKEEKERYEKELSAVCENIRKVEEKLKKVVAEEVLTILPKIEWELRIRRVQDLSFLWIEFKAIQETHYMPNELFDLLQDCDSVEYREYNARVVAVDGEAYLRFKDSTSTLKFIEKYGLKVRLTELENVIKLLDGYLTGLRTLFDTFREENRKNDL